jgi:hypothetical protein
MASRYAPLTIHNRPNTNFPDAPIAQTSYNDFLDSQQDIQRYQVRYNGVITQYSNPMTAFKIAIENSAKFSIPAGRFFPADDFGTKCWRYYPNSFFNQMCDDDEKKYADRLFSPMIFTEIDVWTMLSRMVGVY